MGVWATSAALGVNAAPAGHRDLIVTGDGFAAFGGKRYRCAVGRGGISRNKREGDGATPAGSWPIRCVYFRADRVQLPAMNLTQFRLAERDAWCDAPSDANYNHRVTLPYAASTEALWRTDGLYDVVAVLGYNDDPVVPGRGSAIFLHVARANYGPTDGCVALALPNLLEVLRNVDRTSRVVVGP